MVDQAPPPLPDRGVDSYLELDLRLGWKPRPNLEISLVGQNLFDDHHPEFVTETRNQAGVLATEVSRGVYGKIVWRF